VNAPLRVLIVDDSESDSKLIGLALQAATRPVETERVAEPESLRQALLSQSWDAIVCDWAMPAFSALGALEVVKQTGLDLPFIIVSGSIGEDFAAQGMRAGAHDFLLKERLGRLVPAIERELREREGREARRMADAALMAIMECAPAIILVVDVDGKIQFINRVLDVFDKGDVIGSPWLLYMPPSEHAPQSARLQRIIATGISEEYETKITTPTGETLSFSAHMGPMRLKDRVVGAVVVTQDVTEFKRAQAEVAAAQRMASLGTLASGIAHEINTPVQFVSDSIHFLREASRDLFGLVEKLQAARLVALNGAASPELRQAIALADEAEAEADLEYLSENVPQAFERCMEGLGRVTTIVRSMKEFAHPSGDAMSPTDLNRAIQATLAVASSEYKYVAELETDFGELPLVSCYGSEINQVILNMIVNAAHAVADVVKGTEQKGSIRVQTRSEGDYVAISIADSGAGISDDIAHRIFEPFFTTKAVGKGTGQGLALAWAVIKERHGGELRFTSKLGEGTTFFIRLPIAGKPAAAEPSP